MNKYFSIKLALHNIKNNRKFYLPYFMASAGIIAMFYIMVFLASSKDIAVMSANLSIIMYLGVGIMTIFSFVFLFYINSFLMKQRKKEIGLYNILGMEKKHIGKMLFLENLILSAASIAAGLLCGILFSKLIHLILSRVYGAVPPFGITVSLQGILWSTILFGGLFLLTLVVNQMSIHLAKPIELLSGGQTGEKEPKAKWFIAVLGFVCIGAGYYIALTVDDPLEALMLFFVAVALVIAGTYCIFTSGSIAVLKALRKNRAIYYKPGNFTAISGMIYRMKQNAVGLANICILSTMVLVMVSGTVSLFFGMQDTLEVLAPGDINVTAYSDTADFQRETKIIRKSVEKSVKGKDVALASGESVQKVTHLPVVAVEKAEGEYQFKLRKDGENLSEARGFDFVTVETYNAMTGKNLQLAPGEVIVDSRNDKLEQKFSIGGMDFTVKEEVKPYMEAAELSAGIKQVYYVVVTDDSILEKLFDIQEKAYGDRKSWITHRIAINLTGSEEAIQNISMNIIDDFNDAMWKESDVHYEMLSSQIKSDIEENLGGMVNGFLFLGVFLGIVFTFAAALIIYYKQISEGYYDKSKFEIMQKVGMSRTEVKRTIRRQVLMVFFVPLVMAGIHVAAAFRMITNLLLVFNMSNTGLFAVCTAVTFLIFAVIYALVYMVTAREYYKIVG